MDEGWLDTGAGVEDAFIILFICLLPNTTGCFPPMSFVNSLLAAIESLQGFVWNTTSSFSRAYPMN